MRIFASIIDKSGKKRTFPVNTTATSIGRSAQARLRVKDDLCSGVHAKIYLENDCVFIEDLKSKNGVFLNEIKILRQRVYIGDTVKIGNSILQLEDTKMTQEDIEAHTSSSSNRHGGSITIELQSVKDVRKNSAKQSREQKNYVKNAKLFDGVEGNNSKKGADQLIKLEKKAFRIDLILALIISLAPFIYLYRTAPKSFSAIIDTPEKIIVGQNLYYLIACIILFIGFMKWNRGTGNSSIGEKIFKI